MTADLDTRCGEHYRSGGEVLPGRQSDSDAADGGVSSPGDSVDPAGFAASREQFASLLSFLDGGGAAGLSHAELEDRLDRDGRELLRRLLVDHLALRTLREQRLEQVTGDEGRRRGRVESGHARALETVFGTVTVERLAYRAPGVGNLHPADAGLNLPIERHSHGLRKLAALESPRGSFAGAADAIERQTGVRLGKRQVEELAAWRQPCTSFATSRTNRWSSRGCCPATRSWPASRSRLPPAVRAAFRPRSRQVCR